MIRKQKNYKIIVASATCVLNREYVITNCRYIIENSVPVLIEYI